MTRMSPEEEEAVQAELEALQREAMVRPYTPFSLPSPAPLSRIIDADMLTSCISMLQH